MSGYFALVRYLGLGRDASHDFWIHLGKSEIYPVGKELRTAIFAPPKCIAYTINIYMELFTYNLICGVVGLNSNSFTWESTRLEDILSYSFNWCSYNT